MKLKPLFQPAFTFTYLTISLTPAFTIIFVNYMQAIYLTNVPEKHQY